MGRSVVLSASLAPCLARSSHKANPEICKTLLCCSPCGHIQDVVMEPDCVEKWSNLLSFGGTVLVKPRRGGRKHNITKTILARITDWRLKEPSHSMKAELESTSNRKPRVNKYDPDKFLASIVASKLEEGDFKSAIRLICSEDKPALDTPETLAALKHKHPSAPIDSRTPCDPNSF